jgi:transcriptional regulator with XRE-family HTH domain
MPCIFRTIIIKFVLYSKQGIEMNLAHLGKNIKKKREEKNLSLSALAKKAGISKSNLSGIEEGKINPTINTLWSIANALNVTFSELINQNAYDSVSEVTLIEKSENIESYKMKIKNTHFSFPHKNATEDIFVIKGEVLVGEFDSPKILKTGESYTFNATKPHIYKALSNEAVLIVNIKYNKKEKFFEDDFFDDDIEIEINSGVPIKRTNNLNFSPKDKTIKAIEYNSFLYLFKPKKYKRCNNSVDIIAPFSTTKEKKVNILKHFLQLIMDNVEDEIFNKKILYAKYAVENNSFYEALNAINSIEIKEEKKFENQIFEFKNLLKNLKNSTLSYKKEKLIPIHMTSAKSGIFKKSSL